MTDLVGKMTTEEKAKLVNGETFFGTATMPEHGIRKLQFLDGGTGLNFEQLFGEFCSRESVLEGNENSMFGSRKLQKAIEYYYEPEKLNAEEKELHDWITEKLKGQARTDLLFAPGCFPAGILLGCTWNPETVYNVGAALGKEADAYGISLLLGTPNVNMMRDPLNGRLFESLGEDPFLMSKLAPAMVKGVQDNKVAANVKHFAANNQETFRVGVNEIISKRALEELYFPAFHACVDAKVATVMSAYNSINGYPCTENKWLLTDVLRDEWGFDGMVVSDWGAVYHPVEALAAGNDLAMPGPIDGAPLVKGIEDGTLSMDVLNRAADRVLDFINKWENKTENTSVDLEVSDKAAYDAVVEGTVMLKNENDIFPLKGKVSLFGEGAKQFFDCGTGSAGITTNRTGSLTEELKKNMGSDAVYFGELVNDADAVLIVVRQIGMEGNDRKSLLLPKEEQDMLLQNIACAKAMNKKIGVILNVCGPIDCRDFIDDIDGLFCVFLPGMQGAKGLADLLTGKKNPCGKLNVTFPLCYEDTPTCINFPGDGKQVLYGEDIFVGYRYYDKKNVPVLFPFGFGLSYTKFSFGNMQVSSETFSDKVSVSVDITNVGNIIGKEVVSLYVHDVCSTIRKPYKELKGFEKVELLPGEKRTVTFEVTKEMLQSFDTDLDRWEAEEGDFDFIIATSVNDEKARKRVYGDWKSAYTYGLDRPIMELYEDDRIRPILFEIFEKYGLDEGGIYDTYQYNSYKPFSQLLKESKVESVDACFEEKIAAFRKK